MCEAPTEDRRHYSLVNKSSETSLLLIKTRRDVQGLNKYGCKEHFNKTMWAVAHAYTIKHAHIYVCTGMNGGIYLSM